MAELEGLLRQATNTIKGPGRKYWAANWLGGYIFLMTVANIIHTASTGKILPLERYSPVSKGGYGPLPIGYNTRFAAPTVPGKTAYPVGTKTISGIFLWYQSPHLSIQYCILISLVLSSTQIKLKN